MFTLLGFAALQIPLTHLVGSKVTFTVFDVFAPTAGGFLGGISGAIAVLLMQLLNFVWHGAHIQDAGTVIRFFPMLFGVLYFSRKQRLNLIIPLLAIIAFNLHPIGRSVWVYSLFWVIPVICYFFQDRFLLARSLGATFTAHAVGGALWIYFFALPKAVWLSLIPIVIKERIVFAVGIALTYVVCNNVLNYVDKKNILPFRLPVQERYVWKPL